MPANDAGAAHITDYRANGVVNTKAAVSRASLRSSTIMESFKPPFFWSVRNHVPDELHIKGFFDQRTTETAGFEAFEPVWAMVHKLRKAMGNRDARYTLEGMIELDEGYFLVASKDIERGKGTRGRGSEGKQNVAVMAESTPLEDIETGKKEKHVRYFKARMLDSHQSEGVNELVRDCMEDEAIVFSDKSTSISPIWWNCTSPRNRTQRPPRKPSSASCTSTSSFTN